MIIEGHAMAQAVSCWPLTMEARVRARLIHVGFVVDKVALGQVFLRLLWLSSVNIYHSTIALQTHYLRMNSVSTSGSSSET
jgi:hypothetical protein